MIHYHPFLLSYIRPIAGHPRRYSAITLSLDLFIQSLSLNLVGYFLCQSFTFCHYLIFLSKNGKYLYRINQASTYLRIWSTVKMGRKMSSIVLRNRKSGYTTTMTPYKEDSEYWYIIEDKNSDL